MTTASPQSSSHRRRPPYIGDSDQNILAFISNLAKQVAAPPLGYGPAAYGLTEDDAASIIAAADAYQSAFQRAWDPVTRTMPNIAGKNAARDEADQIARRYAQIIKRMPAEKVSDELKIAAGVPLPHSRKKVLRAAVRSWGTLGSSAIETVPKLFIKRGIKPGLYPELTIRFKDSALSTLRMPRESGITHMLLHAQIVAGPLDANVKPRFVLKQTAMRIVAFATRNPVKVRFDRSLLESFGLLRDDVSFGYVGAMFCGQWLNAKGETGPLGPAVYAQVPVRHNMRNISEQRVEGEEAKRSLKPAA